MKKINKISLMGFGLINVLAIPAFANISCLKNNQNLEEKEKEKENIKDKSKDNENEKIKDRNKEEKDKNSDSDKNKDKNETIKPPKVIVPPSKTDQITDNVKHENTSIYFNVDCSKIIWNNEPISKLSKSEFRSKYEGSIRKIFLQNIDKFLRGDISKIENENDINIVFSTIFSGDTTWVLDIVINENKWYYDNKLQDKKLTNTIMLKDFKSVPEVIDTSGGLLNDGVLNASHFKWLVDSFGLESKQSLISINNEYFDKKLKENGYSNQLKIKIKSGSTSNGEITLNLSGKYKWNDLNQDIKISGFRTFNEDKNISVHSIKLSNGNWFTNTMPIQGDSNDISNIISNISSDDWIEKYLLNLEIKNDDVDNHSIIDKNELIKSGFKFECKGTLDSKNNKIINFDINFIFQNCEYQNEKWIENGKKIKWSKATNNKPTVELPKLDDVKKFLVDTVNLNENKLSSHYPSYFLAKANWSKSINMQYFSLEDGVLSNTWEDKIKNKYFNSSQFSFVVDNNSVQSNDFENTLSFNVGLLVEGEYDQRYYNQFNVIGKMKNISNYQIINTNILNNVSVCNYPEDNILIKNIKKVLKKDHIDYVNQLFSNGNIDKKRNIKINKNNLPPLLQTGNLINFEDTDQNVNEKWNKLKKYITPSLFNKDLSISFDNNDSNEPNINFNSKLYKFDDENQFVINSIVYKFDDNMNVEISRFNNQTIHIKIKFYTEVEFDNNTKTYDSQLVLTMTKSNWEDK
ncbi:MAG: hypothetical protein HDR43_03150 [Mycoplasma sp.]|nr:hypothetical protein [Mycoplasma sp.]